MAQTIKMRRSATPSAVPTTGQLALGEVAVNTYDGKVYIKKSVSGVESIVEVGAGGGASVTVSTTAPSTPAAGDLWWDSTYGKLKIYYTDANTSQWVDAFVGTVGPAGPAGADGAAGTINASTVTTYTGVLKGNGTNVVTATAGTDYVAPGGALGTPSSGTLTNCAGLPVGGISATGTPSSSTFLRGDGTWNTPSAGSITHAEGLLGSDVALSANNTWYDGPTVSLAAGTWMVTCHMTHWRSTTTAETVYARISDGTNHHASSQYYHASVAGIGGTLTMTAAITLASTTTIKGQMASSAGAATSLIKAALTANGAGNNASIISAIKVA